MLPHLPNIVKVDSRTVRTDAERAAMDVERAGDGRPPLHHDRADQRVDARLHKSLFDWINELRGADPWVDGSTAAELITSQLFEINIPQNPEPCHGHHCIWVSASTIKSAMTWLSTCAAKCGASLWWVEGARRGVGVGAPRVCHNIYTNKQTNKYIYIYKIYTYIFLNRSHGELNPELQYQKLVC